MNVRDLEDVLRPTPSLRFHGDRLAGAGELDFATNVWPAPRPPLLESVLSAALRDTSYPDQGRARSALAARHGRAEDDVCLTNGACDAFWLIAHAFRPRRAACIHPSFTEPEAALRSVGASVERVMRDPSNWRFAAEAVPDDAEVVVVGNPNNPTGNLDPAHVLERLARPDRLLVVDEAFIDFVGDERESLVSRRAVPGLVVVRSVTKMFGVPGIRAGYLIAPPRVVSLLEGSRQPWSVNALACAALEACARDRDAASSIAKEVARAREEIVSGLLSLGVRVFPSVANFVLLELAHAPVVVAALRRRGIVVRPTDSFPGLGPRHIRVAVRRRQDNDRLLEALAEVLSALPGGG